jgi:hypothetical protein
VLQKYDDLILSEQATICPQSVITLPRSICYSSRILNKFEVNILTHPIRFLHILDTYLKFIIFVHLSANDIPLNINLRYSRFKIDRYRCSMLNPACSLYSYLTDNTECLNLKRKLFLRPQRVTPQRIKFACIIRRPITAENHECKQVS